MDDLIIFCIQIIQWPHQNVNSVISNSTKVWRELGIQIFAWTCSISRGIVYLNANSFFLEKLKKLRQLADES